MRGHPQMMLVGFVDHRPVDLRGHSRFRPSETVDPDLDYVCVPFGYSIDGQARFCRGCGPVKLVGRGRQRWSGVRHSDSTVRGQDRSAIEFALPLLFTNRIEKVAVEAER